MSNNPAFNLAREEVFCDLCRVGNFEGCFFLWQNEPAIILGRFNNIYDEIDINFARENNIKIVRRNSGGGAVYHDLGNINYSFILHDRKKYNLKFFADIIINALVKIGIKGTLEFNHNDLLVNNYKFSGMAQFHKNNILLHHGTLLFDSDLSIIQKVLRRSSPAKKVINLKNFLTRDINIQEFITLLCDIICSQDSLKFFASRNSQPDKNLPDNQNILQDTREDYIKFFDSRDSQHDNADIFFMLGDSDSQHDKNLRDKPDYTRTQEYIKFFAGDNIDLCELNKCVNKLMLAKYLNSDWTLKGEYNHDRIQE